MVNKDISIEVHSSIAPLREEWTSMDKTALDLIAKGKAPIEYSFYQSFAWNEFVERYYDRKGFLWHRAKEIEYITLRADGKIKIILPILITRFPQKKVELTSWKTSGINNASFAGDQNRDPEETDLWFARLSEFAASRHKGFKLKFNDMPAGVPLVKAMSSLPDLHERQRPSYHVPVGNFSSFDEYYASLSKNFHTGYRRCCNHFTHGDLTREFKIFDRENPPSTAYWKKLWGMYFLRKIDWKKKSRSLWRRLYATHECDSEISSGMKTASFAALDNARLFVMEINGEPAAFCMAYFFGPTGVMPKFAIDTRQSAHSPGILMFMDVMKWCFDNGISDFDLCRGDERYKQRVGGILAPLSGIRGKL